VYCAAKSSLKLASFQFEIVKVDSQGKIIEKIRNWTRYFTENLGEQNDLEMVLIPSGIFTMGTPFTEKNSTDWERPQHLAIIQPFAMSKYPVTQSQWRFVAGLPKIKRGLELNPSRFSGDFLPVEQVSWYEAIEFCARLSQYTGKQYALPSETQWEYACRAGTTTPFHYGETLNTDLANYDGSHTYQKETSGIYRMATSPVGMFPPNLFGLYDLHGNVWEWCIDTWQIDYTNAPSDCLPWLSSDNINHSPLRGGAWYSTPEECRSGYRFLCLAGRDIKFFGIGFRLICRDFVIF
jgi:formylglycine-generating enzyme required for sulfatase activity